VFDTIIAGQAPLPDYELDDILGRDDDPEGGGPSVQEILKTRKKGEG
jgi:hypothetical protein